MGLEAVAIAAITATGVIQAVSAVQAGKSARKAEQYNAAVARQEATVVQESAKLDIERQKREQKAFSSKQRALYAKAGVQLSGSPLEVLADTAYAFEMDQAITSYNAQIGAQQSESRARYSEYLGSTYYREGVVKAGTTLLGTVGRVASFAAP